MTEAATAGADRLDYKHGLFVLAVAGDDRVTIKNDDRFRPRDFGLELPRLREDW